MRRGVGRMMMIIGREKRGFFGKKKNEIKNGEQGLFISLDIKKI